MSDEVKRAAERLRDLYSEGRGYDDDMADIASTTQFHLDDLECVVMAYLAEHANDAENALPLSAEILLASGWYFSRTLGGYFHEGFIFHFPRLSNEKSQKWTVSAVDREFGHIETVGDLRRLLEALHVPAVVVVPKGGE